MTQKKDLIQKMAEFFTSEDFFEKGEDARLELSPDDVRCMNEIIKACSNAIDRTEAIRIASGYCHFSNVAKELAKLPPVTAEPKMGRWIANAPQYDMLNPQYICSECGNSHTRTTPYCEMCGAKMQEVEE